MKILVVDDQYGIRFVFKTFFEQKGHFVEEAENGKEALSIIKKTEVKFDLIITDIEMPIMDGIELARKLTKDIPIIFMSGSPNSLEKAQKAGFPNFLGILPKLFKVEMLNEIIRMVSLKTA